MNKLFKTILSIALFMVAGFVGQDVFAQASCTIDSVKFSPILKGSEGIQTQEVADTYTNVTVESQNCENGLSFKLMSINEDQPANDTYQIENMPVKIIPDNGVVSFQILLDEKPCFGDNADSDQWGYDCVNYLEISNNGKIKKGQPTLLTKNYTQNTPHKEILNNGIFVGNCNGVCISSDEWIYTENTYNGVVACESIYAKLNDTYIINTGSGGQYSSSQVKTMTPQQLESGEKYKLGINIQAKSINNSCLGIENKIIIKGKKTTQQIEKKYNFPGVINADGKSYHRDNEPSFKIPLSDLCDGTDCSLSYEYLLEGSTKKSNKTYKFKCSEDVNDPTLIGCKSFIHAQIGYSIFLGNETNTGASQKKCSVESAIWEITDYDKQQRPVLGGSIGKLKIDFNENECQNQNLKLSLRQINEDGEYQYDIVNGYHEYDLVNSGNSQTKTSHYFVPPADGNYEISFKTGHDECDSKSVKFNCLLGIFIDKENDVNIFKSKGIPLSTIGQGQTYSFTNFSKQKNLKNGLIYGQKRPGISGQLNWKITGENGLDSNQEENLQQANPVEPTYDTTSPCFISNNKLTGQEKIDNPKGKYDENCYELLAAIPGIGKTTKDINGNSRTAINDLKNYELGNYIQQLFNVALGILMVLSVIMIVVAGVEYMTVESIYGKSDAKKRIVGATTGLILALGIFLILKTINPKLLEINFGDGIDEVKIEVEEAEDGIQRAAISPADYIKRYANSDKCDETKNNSTCVNIPNGITIKLGAGKQVEKVFAQELAKFNAKLSSTSVGGNWQVTEAFKRTREHKSKCHYQGTCIDMNFTGSIKEKPTVVNIKNVIDTANSIGLCAIYELGTRKMTKAEGEPERKKLIDAGIPAGKVKNYAGWISAPHFSLYNSEYKC